MSSIASLRHHFLIAMPGLTDPTFSDSLIYLCEHNEEGSMGLIINKPLAITWANIFHKISPEHSNQSDDPVYIGGPVQVERGFVLHTPTKQQWDSSMTVADEVAMTTSTDIIEALSHRQGPSKALICLGYSGWDPGQLESEIANNAWLSVPANNDILFNTPTAEKATAAANILGVDLSLISADSGHA